MAITGLAWLPQPVAHGSIQEAVQSDAAGESETIYPVCRPDTPWNTSIFEPQSPPAHTIQGLAWLVLGITAGIFVIVEGLLVYSIIRYRRSKTDDGSDAVQVYGSNPVELAWTIVPVIIVFTLALVTIRIIREVELEEPPEGAMEVVVVGHQWWWEFRYPELDIITANEMHVPVDRPIWLKLESADVIHSFWMPRLAGKTDVIPNHVNHTWFQAEAPGLYTGQCAEYCGNQHANMLLRVYAHPQEDFEAWVVQQQEPPPAEDSVAAGRRVFQQYACMNCHAIEGTSVGTFGPDLTHLMSRDTIGAGVAENGRESLLAWVNDPQQVKPGCNMPSLKLTRQELHDVVDYLLTLK
ncbi:MAG: cytochrome c oxidase subunit II [Phycisphaerae bacterium]|nr:cytochrome c oxidase subunit II [Phycisphaerae bacterium]